MSNMKLKNIITESREFVIIDPRGNARPVGMKSQGAQYIKKMGGPSKGYFMVLKKNALKARRAMEKSGMRYKDSKLQDTMFDLMYEGELQEGDNTQYSWGQINKALMKNGMQPKNILRFLSILKKTK